MQQFSRFSIVDLNLVWEIFNVIPYPIPHVSTDNGLAMTGWETWRVKSIGI